MGAKFSLVRGTKDILGDDVKVWQGVESCARRIFSLYGYREIRTPILEPEELFRRSLGQDSEVVGKQMFTLRRSGDDTDATGPGRIVLRPEGTAGVLRAFLENNLDKTEGLVKVYYLGPMFRAERPQKGRLRQFHHIGAEAIGSFDAILDAEIIALSAEILESIGLSGYDIEINSLGCAKDKQRLGDNLCRQLKGNVSRLCRDCQRRYGHNIFRVLDCKNRDCRNIVSGLDISLQDYLCPDCLSHFSLLRDSLNDIGLRYKENRHLVRGLDYYTRTVFEIKHPALGAQDALGAGGRYDNLTQQLGGGAAGAAGFALGVERLILAMSSSAQDAQPVQQGLVFGVYIIGLGDDARRECFKVATELRKNNILAEMGRGERSLKSQLRRANNSRLRWALIIGEDEMKDNCVLLKDMEKSLQEKVRRGDVLKSLRPSGELRAMNFPIEAKPR